MWTVLRRAAEPTRTDPSPLGHHRWAATIQAEEFGPFEVFWAKGEVAEVYSFVVGGFDVDVHVSEAPLIRQVGCQSWTNFSVSCGLQIVAP